MGVEVQLGDGDDALVIDGRAPKDWCDCLSAFGEGGNDALTGAEGSEILSGGAGSDRLLGGSGDDRLVDGERDAEAASDQVDGGEGLDEVDYRRRRADLRVDLEAGLAGAEGEGDRLAAVEDAITGRGDDRLSGSGGPNRLNGMGGHNVLRGRGGDDHLVTGGVRTLADGGPGNDVFGDVGIDSRAADIAVGGPRVRCGAGFDVLEWEQFEDYVSRAKSLREAPHLRSGCEFLSTSAPAGDDADDPPIDQGTLLGPRARLPAGALARHTAPKGRVTVTVTRRGHVVARAVRRLTESQSSFGVYPNRRGRRLLERGGSHRVLLHISEDGGQLQLFAYVTLR